ncbi:MAG: phosphoribosylformylglycinamidine synthase subunit PurL [Nitrososphaeraceae archaeon]
MESLTKDELIYLKKSLKRIPNQLEKEIVGAEWSEHCSYKSSKKYIKLLPTKGSRIIIGPGYDAGVIDVGDGDIITIHIESHNHPSAVEPYGGAATGVGGILRDIISMGTMPIAILNALRFGNITTNNEDDKINSNAKWLLRNVVKGISDYGNCVGIPTVAGEVEFDRSFNDYCLVDVAAIGLGKKNEIIRNKVNTDDVIVLAGGLTGRDGIHGASFASKELEEENRSAVQIPDPFLEKLLIEVTREAIENDLLKSVKDLGGGGLSCCLSETSSNLGKGFDIELSSVPIKYKNMNSIEIMISESQERMLFITSNEKINKLRNILKKYEIPFAVIGQVKNHKNLILRNNGKVIANMPSDLIAHSPLLDRKSRKPRYLNQLKMKKMEYRKKLNYKEIILKMLSNPTIASKNWIFQQYDQEIGLRTILKPNNVTDACVMKLTDNKFISMKLDGNSKMCYLDPYFGTLAILSESRRNIICTGAEPIGLVDHLQFGNPENPEIFWTFKETIKAIIEFSKFNKIPVVGGKVSLYNETKNGNIKPSPVIGMIGLMNDENMITKSYPECDCVLFLIGSTKNELGGSEYYNYIWNFDGGKIPKLNMELDSIHSKIILELIKKKMIESVHDCSNGGLAVAITEISLESNKGITINLDKVPNECKKIEELLFSESPSRYIICTTKPKEVTNYIQKIKKVKFGMIGKIDKSKRYIYFKKKDKEVCKIDIKEAREKYEIISKIMEK